MNQEQFDVILQRRLDLTLQTAGAKGKEYSGSGADRFHNFKQAARMSRRSDETQAEALWGMFRKHLVSLMDMIEDSKNGAIIGQKKLDEKCGDVVVYTCLLEAMLREEDENRLENNKISIALATKESGKLPYPRRDAAGICTCCSINNTKSA